MSQLDNAIDQLMIRWGNEAVQKALDEAIKRQKEFKRVENLEREVTRLKLALEIAENKATKLDTSSSQNVYDYCQSCGTRIQYNGDCGC